MPCGSLPRRDQALVQIVDAALTDSARRSGKWLACRPGCSQCCVGVFAINQLDVLRLQKGFAELEQRAPVRATQVRERAHDTVARLSHDFPGDPSTGLIDEEDESEESAQQWADFGNDEPCPALDPATGTCELYEFRPIICRTFGPPLMSEGETELGVCDLCFDGATDEEISAAEIHPDPSNLEPELLKELESTTGAHGETIVAFALTLAR